MSQRFICVFDIYMFFFVFFFTLCLEYQVMKNWISVAIHNDYKFQWRYNIPIDRALKTYKMMCTGTVVSKFTLQCLGAGTDTLGICICFYNSIWHTLTKMLSFCSSFNALFTNTSCIEIGVWSQKLMSLEFNFHYW